MREHLERLSVREERMLRNAQLTHELNRGATFRPNGKQENLIKLVGDWDYSKIRIRVIIASFANGVGKTACAANILNSIVNPPANHWFAQHPLYHSWPFEKRLRVIGTPDNIKPSGPVNDEMEKWIKAQTYERRQMGKAHYAEWTFNSGFHLQMMSSEQHPKTMEGVNLGFCWIDEPVSQAVYQANITRLRGRGGLMLITATLIGDTAEWMDELIDKADGEGVCHLKATDEDACKKHGTRGHRDHDEIMAMRERMTADEDEISVRTGKTHSLRAAGAVFKEFQHSPRAKVHVQPEARLPKLRDCTIYQGVDPHSRRPWAMVWIACDREGHYWVFDEWPDQRNYKTPFHKMEGKSFGVAEHVEEMHRIESLHGISGRVQTRMIDGAFAGRGLLGDPEKRSLVEVLSGDYAINYELSSVKTPRRSLQIGVLHDLLRWNPHAFDPEHLHGDGAPRLYVTENCTNTIRSLRFHRYKRGATAHTKVHRFSDESEEHKDFIDCLTFVTEHNPGFTGGYRDTNHPVESRPDFMTIPGGVKF